MLVILAVSLQVIGPRAREHEQRLQAQRGKLAKIKPASKKRQERKSS